MKKLSLKELYEINNKFPHDSNIRQLYFFDVIQQEWKFNGYKCCQCHRLFSKEGYIRQHKEKCPKGKKPVDEIQGKILTVDRQPWHPIDINQN